MPTQSLGTRGWGTRGSEYERNADELVSRFQRAADTPDLSARCGPIGRTRADDKGWYQVHFPLLQTSVEVNRWLAGVDDIRAELNTWAAWVEVNSGPELGWLMHHLVTAAQLLMPGK